ncbi:hypothetical protein CCACVL1_27725 [Corchorus capsularis]|uniref:Uncharacterized protein n=1 Tax=Corchorus capsularis TaxID=210143 RepID=A0A1R3G924_COCAP|nr:hypothetical protein CCACVL1_27725 [Corchorus capsularis]
MSTEYALCEMGRMKFDAGLAIAGFDL